MNELSNVKCPFCGYHFKLPEIRSARWVIDRAQLYQGSMTCTNPDCAAKCKEMERKKV